MPDKSKNHRTLPHHCRKYLNDPSAPQSKTRVRSLSSLIGTVPETRAHVPDASLDARRTPMVAPTRTRISRQLILPSQPRARRPKFYYTREREAGRDTRG